MDAEEKLTRILSEQLAKDVDKSIIDSLLEDERKIQAKIKNRNDNIDKIIND